MKKYDEIIYLENPILADQKKLKAYLIGLFQSKRNYQLVFAQNYSQTVDEAFDSIIREQGLGDADFDYKFVE